MEIGIQPEGAPHTGTARMYRVLAALALLPSCFLAGCAGEKGVDAGNSSSAPYSSSETATPQPETDGSKKIIDIDNNSMYYTKYDNREGFSAYCVGRDYENPQIADCSVYLCDGERYGSV